MYKILSITMVLLVSACGSIEQRNSGIEQDTLLVISGEALVGLKIQVEPGIVRTISSSDLTPYPHGILGAKDPDIENLQTVVLKIDKGNHMVTISSNRETLIRRDIYFVDGQTRKLRIPQK